MLKICHQCDEWVLGTFEGLFYAFQVPLVHAITCTLHVLETI